MNFVNINNNKCLGSSNKVCLPEKKVVAPTLGNRSVTMDVVHICKSNSVHANGYSPLVHVHATKESWNKFEENLVNGTYDEKEENIHVGSICTCYRCRAGRTVAVVDRNLTVSVRVTTLLAIIGGMGYSVGWKSTFSFFIQAVIFLFCLCKAPVWIMVSKLLEWNNPHIRLLLELQSPGTSFRLKQTRRSPAAVFKPTTQLEREHNEALFCAGKVELRSGLPDKMNIVIVPQKNLDPPTNIRRPRNVRFHPIVEKKMVPSLKNNKDMYDRVEYECMVLKNRREVAEEGKQQNEWKHYFNLAVTEEMLWRLWRKRYSNAICGLKDVVEVVDGDDIGSEETMMVVDDNNGVEVTAVDEDAVEDDDNGNNNEETVAVDMVMDHSDNNEPETVAKDEDIPKNSTAPTTLGSFVEEVTGRRRSTRLARKNSSQNTNTINTPTASLGSLFVDGGRRRSARLARLG
jgi:hypothetical protein